MSLHDLRDEAELKKLEQEEKEISEEISEEEKNLKSINEEIENLEIDADVLGGRVAFYDLLIKDLVQEFGESGEEIFREMFPDEAEEILKK